MDNYNSNEGKDMHSVSDTGGEPGFTGRYGLDYVAAIVQSPTSLFVYWELSGQRSDHYRRNGPGEVCWCLSLINLDESGSVRWRTCVPVDPDSGNYYLRVQPGNRYRVELGVRMGGDFHPVCHSRERTTPRDAPPPASRLHWPETAPGAHVGEHKDIASGSKPPAGLIWERDLIENAGSST